MSLNIIPKPAQDRVLKDSSDYCNDIANDHDKIPYDESGNLISGGFNFSFENRDKQCREMDALLSQNKNFNAKPLQHLVFAYGTKKQTHSQIRRHIERYLKNVGMQDHMCLYDAHDNTDHFHVHLLLCRLAHEPDDEGTYKIADNGLFKTKNEEGVLRTNEAICRQATIAQICKEEGWDPPDGLKYDEGGKPIHRKGKKQNKGFHGILSKSDQLAALAWDIFKTSKEIMEPAERLASLGIKIQLVQKSGKIVGAKLITKDTSCSFSKMCPEQKGLYQKLSKQFALAPTDSHPVPANTSPFHAEDHLRALMRDVFQEPARFGKSWNYLIGAVESHGAHIERSGGGLIVVRDGIKITTSSITNKCSLSKLEKVLGSCPIQKTAPVSIPRDALIQEAAEIFSKHISNRHGLHYIKLDLASAGISITKKSFKTNNSECKFYYAVERDGVSVPISSISKNKDNKPVYTMYLFERLDRNNPYLQYEKFIDEKRRQFNETNRRCSPGGDLYEEYILNESQHKKERVEKLSFFAAIAKFTKLKHTEKENVHTNSEVFDKPKSINGEISYPEQMFRM